jgi:hypothetical protein
MYNNSHSAAGPNESGVKTAHEYIRDILPFRYQKCISCGNRTDLTCVRCSYCYSCHWKKEKEERRLVEDKISEIFPSPLWEKSTKEAQQQLIPEKPMRQLMHMVERLNQYVVTIVVIISFQIMVLVDVNVNIRLTRH